MDAPTCNHHHERTARLEAKMEAQANWNTRIEAGMERLISAQITTQTQLATLVANQETSWKNKLLSVLTYIAAGGAGAGLSQLLH